MCDPITIVVMGHPVRAAVELLITFHFLIKMSALLILGLHWSRDIATIG